MEVFKKPHINILFADALVQMPSNVRFMKDILSRKRWLSNFETMNLTEECSAILQRKLPQKLKDPGNLETSLVQNDKKELGEEAEEYVKWMDSFVFLLNRMY